HITRALFLEIHLFFERGLNQVREFQILNENLEEFFTGKRELNAVFPVALFAGFFPALALSAFRRPFDLISCGKLLVPRQYPIMFSLAVI
ncbi:hypothetical protein O4H28_18355, partial [Brachybacterium paraconglomeratum]